LTAAQPRDTLPVVAQTVTVRADGYFASVTHSAKPQLAVEAERKGKKKVVTRRFVIGP